MPRYGILVMHGTPETDPTKPTPEGTFLEWAGDAPDRDAACNLAAAYRDKHGEEREPLQFNLEEL